METIRQVKFEEVLEYFERNHPVTNESHSRKNDWGQKNITIANAKCTNGWQLVELSPDEINNIWLPHHRGEQGTDTLIEGEGLKVSDAVQKLKKFSEYQITNPECWNLIQFWKDKDITPIFLTTSIPEHIKEAEFGTKLFHLDGLHRLLAWGLKSESSNIQAFLAIGK